MGLTKAKLIVQKESGKSTIPIMFNPAEYNLVDSANYAEKNIPGIDGPVSQFISGAATTLSINLILDTTIPPTAADIKKMNGKKPEDVSKKVKEITALTAIDGKQHRPPLVTFSWGSLNFKGVVIRVTQNYTMFEESGKPLRAKVAVEFKSVTDIKNAKKKSPFESPDRTKYRMMKEGMQLWNLAQDEYGSPDMWRIIAEENKITDPLHIPVGRMLKIPAL